jgi:hypothetical protein
MPGKTHKPVRVLAAAASVLLSTCAISAFSHAVPQSAASSAPPPRYSDLQNFGWRGPVKSIRTTTTRVAPDPRLNPKLHIFTHHGPWVVFDQAGFMVETAAGDSEGNIKSLQRTERDLQGRVLRTLSFDADGKPTVLPEQRTERRMGPHGPLEEKHYSGDRLQHRTEKEYDADGRELENRIYDAEGRLTSHASTRYDAHGRTLEWRVASPEKLHVHIRNRYNIPRYGDARDMGSREWLDADGNVIRSLALDRGRLVSYWQHPECGCEGNMGFVFTGRTVTYRFQADGSLLTEVQYHPGRRGSIEMDAAELKDESGQILEKVAMRYERDSHGNWVARSVLVMDARTAEMVEIQRDVRVITYY